MAVLVSSQEAKESLYYVKMNLFEEMKKGWSFEMRDVQIPGDSSSSSRTFTIRTAEKPGPIVPLSLLQSHKFIKPTLSSWSSQTFPSRLFTYYSATVRRPGYNEPCLSGWRYPRWWDVTALFVSYHMMGVEGFNEPFFQPARDDAWSLSTAEI